MTIEWQPTRGKAKGSFASNDGRLLYVREDLQPDGDPTGGWRWLIDGVLMGVERDESAARAAAEAAIGAMGRTHAGRLAASA